MNLPTVGFRLLLVTLCLTNLSPAASDQTKPSVRKTERAGKLFSLFQVIKFPNDGCIGSGSKNGTCYTTAECSAKGGINGGSCAQGYGVCCIFTLQCGGVSTQNCSYFESTGSEVGQCFISACKCNANICQIRLDFNTFSITGPSTSTIVTTGFVNGQPTANPTAPNFQGYTPATQCLTDIFTVTNPGGQAPPASVALTPDSTISQYSCDYINLAPQGCTQYYFGATSQCVQTYNYAGNVHLSNQNQNICIRKERQFCRICWSTVSVTDFQVSGTTAAGIIAPSKCCGYGGFTVGTPSFPGIAIPGVGYDCVTIPGAEMEANSNPLSVSRFCGKSQGLVSKTNANTAATICSSSQPFQLRFVSDNGELGPETTTAINKGFKLCYIESASNC